MFKHKLTSLSAIKAAHREAGGSDFKLAWVRERRGRFAQSVAPVSDGCLFIESVQEFKGDPRRYRVRFINADNPQSLQTIVWTPTLLAAKREMRARAKDWEGWAVEKGRID